MQDFYDDYVARQTAVGVNARHRAILARLRRSGLNANHACLEIGCGVGTLTELIAKDLRKQGSIVAVDVSPKSIEAARRRLAGFDNVHLIASDILGIDLARSLGRFDVVVLADVVDHIPLAEHGRLFERIATWLRPDGFVLLNYPNPQYQEWRRRSSPDPDLAKIAIQPVHLDALLANAYPHGFYLDRFEKYSIWVQEGDYVCAVLRPSGGSGGFTHVSGRRGSVAARIGRRLRRLRVRRSRMQLLSESSCRSAFTEPPAARGC